MLALAYKSFDGLKKEQKACYDLQKEYFKDSKTIFDNYSQIIKAPTC
jgi:hypothetical protein